MHRLPSPSALSSHGGATASIPHEPSTGTRDCPQGVGNGVVRRIERYVVAHPKVMLGIHVTMIAFYLALILIPPWLPKASANASPLSNFVSFSRFVIWCIWWPFVTLSTLGFGRLWCGIFCPEGALSAYASRFGSHRPVPEWMRFGAIPLFAFVAITILGQLFEVDEAAMPQLVILGGSTLMAVLVGLVYTKRVWAWCRYLCPVSLLFGVFSRLGAMHFRVDHERLQLWDRTAANSDKKEPCPVHIHLPVMATNRYCLMCFRCVGWRDSIHLAMRKPGEELLRINLSEPLLWEVMFLFGGAIGLPLGVFHAEIRELEGVRLVGLLLFSTALSIGVLSLLTGISARILQPGLQRDSVRERFTYLGYAFTPLSLFSLFLGLSKPTFEYFESIGFPSIGSDIVRLVLLAAGTVWSLYLGRHIVNLQKNNPWRTRLSLLPLVAGIGLVLCAWIPVFRRG